MNLRVGSGFDVHAFGDGEGLPVGGVWIPHDRGVLAHSDGDVLVHALCDALLGAMGLGDIGEHFPPNDDRWKGAAGKTLLREVMDKLESADYRLVNADLTVIAQRPRIGPHKQAIKETLCALLGVDSSQLNVKATTTEKLGFTGRGEGIAAMAQVLVERTVE